MTEQEHEGLMEKVQKSEVRKQRLCVGKGNSRTRMLADH